MTRPTSRHTPRPTMRHRLGAAGATLLLVALGACSSNAEDASPTSAAGTVDVTTVSATAPSLSDTHADGDDGEYESSDATTITLADGASAVQGAGADVEGDVVTITEAGTFLLSGELSDGQVVVDSPGEGEVVVVLDGVDITSSDSSPLVVSAADEAVVVLADGSTNSLADSADSAADDDEEDAPTATLFSMADLTIAGDGALDVTGESNDGVTSKDGLVVLSGTLTVHAVDDGIRGKDYLVVEDGDISVRASGDGLKSDNDTAGELGWILVDGGTLRVSSGSDGADAVGAIYVAGGAVSVARSAEGLEAAVITVAGGTTDISASDDGVNATSGTVSGGAEQAEDGVLLTVSGGTLVIDAGSDGIDSNGSAELTGGTTVISTPSVGGGGNGTFDVNGTFTAPAIVTVPTEDVTAGQLIAVADSDGEVVAAFAYAEGVSAPVVAATGLEAGSTYGVYAGEGDATTLTSVEGLTEIASVTAEDADSAATAGFRGGPGGGPEGGPGGVPPEGGFPGGAPPEDGLPGGTPPDQGPSSQSSTT